MMTRLISIVAFVAILLGVVSEGRAETVFMKDNLVIRQAFEGGFDNVADGAASAGVLGAAVQGGDTPATFVPSQPSGGLAIRFPPAGWCGLAYNDAAVADVVGSTGVTFSMWIVHGRTPRGMPAWFFNADSSQGVFGMRINSNSDEFRASSPGGFFATGVADKRHWRHIAYAMVPEGGQFRAKFYIDGKLNGISPELFDKIEVVKSARIGSYSSGGEMRLNNTLIDDFRLYNVGMTDGQIATLAAEGGKAGTPAQARPKPAKPKPTASSGSSETPPAKSIAPKQNDEAKLGNRLKQPFIVYTRDYTMPCFANYVPTPKEASAGLKMEMAAKEYEPLQIGIYVPSGADAVSDLRIEVDIDIPSESGYLYYHTTGQVWRPVDEGKFPPNAVGGRWWYSDYPGGRRVMPRYLVPSARVKRIEPGRSAGIWITFNTNDRVRPGVHLGTVVLTRQGGKPQRLPLEVVVRPFALPRPKALFSLYYRPDRIPNYWDRPYQEQYARHMAATGSNSGQIVSFFSRFGTEAYQAESKVPTSDWMKFWLALLDPKEYADGKVDPGRLVEAQIEMFEKAGLISPDIPIWSVQDHPTTQNKAFIADKFRQMSIERNWPEVLFMTRDEPPPWIREDAMQPAWVNAMLDWKRMKNARTFTALSGPSEISWGHLHDIKIVLGGMITPEMLREAKRQGGQLFTYLERLRLTNVLINRFYAGLYTWGLGLAGNTPYCYCHATNGAWLPEQERISEPMINCYVIPGPDGPIPGVGLEGRREGIDDYRYLQLLEARVAAAGPELAVAKDAAGWLANLKRHIETAAIDGVFGAGFIHFWELDWVDPAPNIDPEEYNEIRKTAARYIAQLPAAPGESNAPVTSADRQFPVSGWEGESFHERSLDQCLGALQQGSIADKRGAANAILFKDIDTLDAGKSAAYIKALASLLENPDVRMPAMRALRDFGPKAAPALDAIKRQLQAEDPYIRCGAILALESMGTVAIDALILALEDPFPNNSALAAESLNRMAPDAARAIPALKQAMAASTLRVHKGALKSVIDSISQPAP